MSTTAPLPAVASALEPSFDPFAQRNEGVANNAEHDHSQHDHSQHDHSQQGAAPAAEAQPGTARYTCPMHPEVVRDAPGSCPLCGMHLVLPKAPTSTESTPNDIPTAEEAAP
jgi:hypothetical protein